MARITTETLRTLSERASASGQVVSIYVDLDPGRFGAAGARASEVASLIDAARRDADETVGEHGPREMVHDMIGRLEAFLKDASFDAARGLAVFCRSPDAIDAVKLPEPVEPKAVVDEAPVLSPLLPLVRDDEWCLLLVNRRGARIMRGTRDALELVSTVDDDVPNRHEAGGWSQSRFQRHVDDHVHGHVRNACEELFRIFDRRPFDRLLVAAPSDLWTEMDKGLHPYLRERLTGRVRADIEWASAEEALERVRPEMDEAERRAELDALRRLGDPPSRGAHGVGNVLSAVNDGRVDLLLMEPSFDAPGAVCPACSRLEPSGTGCPADGAQLRHRRSLREDVIAAVLSRAGRVRLLSDARDLPGGIAALLRY